MSAYEPDLPRPFVPAMPFYACFVPVRNYAAARRRYPRAAVIAREGGEFIAFASRADYRSWKDWKKQNDRSV